VRNIIVNDEISTRFKYVFGGVVLFAVAILIQLFRWQIIHNAEYEAAAKVLVASDYSYKTERGLIYDCNMTVLATDEPSWFVYISVGNNTLDTRNYEAHQTEIKNRLFEVLSLTDEEIEAINKYPMSYIPIKHGVTEEMRKQIQEEDLFGVYFSEEYKRVYPNGKLASNVLGYIGKNENGTEEGYYGVTGYFYKDLVGYQGYVEGERDISGDLILLGDYDQIRPKKGKDIVLTLDVTIQRKVEDVLKKGVVDTGAKSGSAIVMDPKTGKIIAMATYPTYDPNEYYKIMSYENLRNRCISNSYEYGSINKVVTISSAMDYGLIDEDYICDDKYGYMKIYDRTIYTWDKRPDGVQTPVDVLRNSNNVCSAKIGLEMSYEQQYRKLKEFGLVDPININLAGEETGWCPEPALWSDVDQATISFGQTFSATPLQVVSAISTIANDGDRMQPYVVEKVISEDGEVVYKPKVVARPVSKETAEKMRGMLGDIISDSSISPQFDALKEYKIGGKTGTSQIPISDVGSGNTGYREDVTNATFVGFAPYDNPQVIMLVWIEEPTSHTLANQTAVPIWVQMFDSIKNDVIEL